MHQAFIFWFGVINYLVLLIIMIDVLSEGRSRRLVISELLSLDKRVR